MTDKDKCKRDEIKNLLYERIHGDGIKFYDKYAIRELVNDFVKWHNRKIREEMLALLPEKRDTFNQAIGKFLEVNGWNDCIDAIRNEIEEKYKA